VTLTGLAVALGAFAYVKLGTRAGRRFRSFTFSIFEVDPALAAGKINDFHEVFRRCALKLISVPVADTVVVEVKAVERLTPLHEAQLLTYLRLGGWKAGLLINFNVPLLRDGIVRRVLGLQE